MNDINKLINTYYNSEGANTTAYPKKEPRERYTRTYRQQQRQEANKKNRHLILTTLLNETPFHLTKTQIQEIRYWIDTFNPYWKHFHRQASDETILLAMIMIQGKHDNKRLKVEQYSISQKYHLTTPIFTNIQNQLIFELMRTTPLTYNKYTKLYKENNEKENE